MYCERQVIIYTWIKKGCLAIEVCASESAKDGIPWYLVVDGPGEGLISSLGQDGGLAGAWAS